MKKYKSQKVLSMQSLGNWIKELKVSEKQYPKVAVRIADRLADEMLENTYPDTYKVPGRLREGGLVAEAGIRNDEPKWKYHEYGTGVIGSQFPHIAEVLQSIGWKYDVNNHGEKGWWYPTTESDPNPYKWKDETGQLRAWTRGLVAERAFYEALQRVEELFPEISREELLKEVSNK